MVQFASYLRRVLFSLVYMALLLWYKRHCLGIVQSELMHILSRFKQDTYSSL